MAIPVSPPLWFESLRRTNASLKNGELPLEAALRHIYHLRQLAPGAIGLIFPQEVEERAFRKALKKGHLEEAFSLILNSSLFELESSADGSVYQAKVRTGVFDASGKAETQDPASARVIAWLECIASIETACQEERVNS